MTEELYKKHRPPTLDRMLGNRETLLSLTTMVREKRLPHSILFTGPSGTGKTSLARILASALECSEMDYVEINTANNRGIDTVRDIQDKIHMHPMQGPVRIYTIDECHQLTGTAADAILKMLEDTPAHVYFFLCTTNPQKLSKAILTRCCEMPLRPLTFDEMVVLCDRTARKEKFTISDDVRKHIITCSQGSGRMFMVLLDKIRNLDPDDQVAAIESKLSEENEAIDLCRALMDGKAPWKKVVEILRNLKGEVENTRWAVLGYARACLMREENHRAYVVIRAFEQPFYDSKESGLIAACYQVKSAK